MGHVQVSYTFDATPGVASEFQMGLPQLTGAQQPAHTHSLDIFGSEKRTQETWREGEYRLDEAPHPQWPDSRQMEHLPLGIIRLNSCRMNLRHFRQSYHFCISLVIFKVNSLNKLWQY